MARNIKKRTNLAFCDNVFVNGTVVSISISNHEQCAFDSFLRYVLFPG